MATASLPNLPDVLKIEDLSALIGKTATTIRTCSSNPKYAKYIPRPFKLPNSRRLYWYKDEVLAWMAQAKTVQPADKSAGRRGPPTKAERVAADRAGVSVKVWREQKDSSGATNK